MKRVLVVAAATLLIMVVTAVAADDEAIRVHPVGYQETPAIINSPGSGEFKAKIHSDGSAIDCELTYRDLSSRVLQSHIHLGRPGLTTNSSRDYYRHPHCRQRHPPSGYVHRYAPDMQRTGY